MNRDLQIVALRQKALYLPVDAPAEAAPLTASTIESLRLLRRNGFTLDEAALRAFNALSAAEQGEILSVTNDVLGTHINWTPLVKGWREPTGENAADHLLTFFSNIAISCGLPVEGTILPCGHLIPDGTFNLERYNGCPFCGKPFEINHPIAYGQGSSVKELMRWTSEDAALYFRNLLESSVPLDATMTDSLDKLLASDLPFPTDAEIRIKETLVLVVKSLLDRKSPEIAGALFRSATDIMRYLWYVHTDNLQIILPKTIVKNTVKTHCGHLGPNSFEAIYKANSAKKELKLHYSRSECRMVAQWLCMLPLSPVAICQQMHAKRGMWVRFIRALRLVEYSKKKGFEKLKQILYCFAKEEYPVAQGIIDSAIKRGDIATALGLLRQHPGVFSRSLFSLILRFGPDKVLPSFRAIVTEIPLNLLVTLGNQAENYFEGGQRIVKIATGNHKLLSPHPYLEKYSLEQREDIIQEVRMLVLDYLAHYYAEKPEEGVKIYIDPALDWITLPVGDRSSNIQDLSSVLQGTQFRIEGDKVRLFLNWGEGLPEQALDLDLSARIVYADKVIDCAYYNLSPMGALHSGDIRHIPEKVGTAEYIELDLDALAADKARFVVFTASNYSGGALNVNAKVGWMSSLFPMAVDDATGVAYDPSCVQHMVKVSQRSMSRTYIFGILDVRERTIMWLELGADAQSAFQVNLTGVLALMHRLKCKITVGKALRIMAQARKMQIVDTPDQADQAYTAQWALDIPAVIHTLL